MKMKDQMVKNGKLSQIWKRPNMALGKSYFFLALKLGLYGGRREEKRREEEKKRRRREENKRKRRRRKNPGLEQLLCLELLYGTHVWKYLSKLG